VWADGHGAWILEQAVHADETKGNSNNPNYWMIAQATRNLPTIFEVGRLCDEARRAGGVDVSARRAVGSIDPWIGEWAIDRPDN